MRSVAGTLSYATERVPLALWTVLGVFALLVVPAIVFGASTSVFHPFLEDANTAHLPQVDYFVSHPFDIRSYPATGAMTPGHHLLLAWASALLGYQTVDETTWVVRLLNAVMGFGFLAVAWVIVRRIETRPWYATALVMPLACSSYVISSAIWVSTDNGALLFYAATLFAVMFRRDDPILTGLSGALLVLWRQIYLPVLGIYVLALAHAGRQASRKSIISAGLALVPAALVVIYFWWIWGGLTPPVYQTVNKNVFTPGVPLHAFALTGLLAVPYGLTLWRAFQSLNHRHIAIVFAALSLVIVVLFALGETNYDKEAGRWASMIWLFVKLGPVIGGDSPILFALSLAGALVLAIILVHAHQGRYFPAAGLMLLLYFVSCSAQIMAWQRYLEPHIMLTLGVFCAQVGNVPRRELAGPLALALVFGLLTAARVYGNLGQLFG